MKSFLSSKYVFREISEGSCYTEDWSNYEKSALITAINYIWKHIKLII